ncbi:hypothetical protein MASR1M45_19700 [Candidatus Kapaibacterium sp.]
MFRLLLSLILFIIFANNLLFANFGLDTGGVKTIMKKPIPKTPIQIMNEAASNKNQNETELPTSEFNYLPEQDSIFYQIMKLNLPVNVILMNELRFSDDLWTIEKRIAEGTPWQLAIQNIRNIPSEFYNPSPVEMVQRQVLIESSFEVPNLRTYNPYAFRLPIAPIMSLLGLTEDVSPKITYTLDYTTNVEVVIYSISSSVVSTLFSGRQTPGYYTLTWNGRDSNGKLMPAGDYIAEVRVGNEKYIRKRIVIR